MNKELIDRFWKDFTIPTQDENLKFPYANPSDAARTLMKGHNWIGTITEDLMDKSGALKEIKGTLLSLDGKIEKMERLIFSQNDPPGWATKNKETQKAFVWAQASPEDLELLKVMEDSRITLKEQIFNLEQEVELLNLMLRTLEQSAERIENYINWCKFELRGQVNG